MLNFKKTKKMEIIGEGNNKTYGTSEDKKDQKKYEEKVRTFLSYCMNFENSLVKKNMSGGIESVEDILVCFNDSFKDYYKKFSKKFGILSSTTKVLNKMEKELKKIKNKQLSDSGISIKVIGAFKYESKRDYSKDYGSRAAIYDQAVYKFFNNEIPEIIEKICKKQMEKSDQQSDFIVFINKMLKKVEKINKQTDKIQHEVLDARQTSEEREEILDKLKNKLKRLKGNIPKNDDKHVGEKVDEISNRIDCLQIENENIGRKIENLEEMTTDLDIGKGILEKLKNGEELTNENKENLRKIGINDIKDKKKIEETIDNIKKQIKRADEIWDDLSLEKDKIEEKIENLKKILERVTKENVEKNKEELDRLVKLDRQAGSLAINGNNGLKAFLNYCSGEGKEQLEFCRRVVGSVILNNIVDINKCINSTNNQGLFDSFESLTSVTANNLSGPIQKVPFSNCVKLAKFNEKNGYNYNIPKSVATIGSGAFFRTGEEVQSGFSANIEAETICEGAFSRSGLTKINLPNATKIESKAFCNCVKLREVVFLKKDVTIDSAAFAGCTNLSKVILPKNIKKAKKINDLKVTICTQANKPEKEGNNDGIEFVIA